MRLNEFTDVKYNPVYLSDLKSVINLYLLQTGSETQKDDKQQFIRPLLTEDFGLPLYVIALNKKIIACSFVLINTAGEIIYKAIVDKEYTENNLEINLINYTKKNYINRDEPINNKNLKNSIYSFVDWLNWCR